VNVLASTRLLVQHVHVVPKTRDATPSGPSLETRHGQNETGLVVVRKNHYGSKSRRGTEIAAIFYTLLETAKLEGVGPAKYLRETALADARGELLLPADIVI
jgi:hypothetical protein